MIIQTKLVIPTVAEESCYLEIRINK